MFNYQKEFLLIHININRFLMEAQIKQYKYRFVIFITYVLAALVNSLPVNTFASLNSTIEKTFQISIVEVSLNTLIFPIAHTFFALPCNWIINKKGLRVSFFISALCNVGGMWLRTFLQPGNPYICLLGSLLSSIGGIFILNTPSRLALNWFRSQQVPITTFVGVLASLVSMAIGITIPGMFISSNSTADDIIAFLRLEAAIVTIPFVILVCLFRQKPPLPPSKAAQAFNNIQKKDYFALIKEIFSNREYIKLCLSMAFNYGICVAYFSALQQILVGIGYKNSSKVISIIGTSGIILGIIGNILYSLILKKTKKFKKIIILTTIGSFLGMSIWVAGLFEHVTLWWQLCIISSFFCFNYFSIPSIYILYSTEVAFPIDQASAAGYLMAISQTFGFLSGIIYANLLDGTKQTARMLLYITISSIFISVIMSISIKEDLRKTRFEQGKKLSDSDNEITEGKESLLTN